MNPFKFGVLVDDEFFTDRINELKEVLWTLNSENHLILISPRRFGKSSLVAKAIKESGRPCISLNMQNILSVEDFASKLLRELFRIYPMERIKHLMTHFRIIPTVSTNPITNGIDVSFQPVMNSIILLEDAMALIEKVSTEEKRLVVVFDEFVPEECEALLELALESPLVFVSLCDCVFVSEVLSVVDSESVVE